MARTPPEQWAALFNFAGGGLIHMELFPAAPIAPLSLEIRRRRRRFSMNTKQLVRYVGGNTVAPTAAVDGTDYDFKAVEGLDVTVENDQDQVLIDFNLVASFSANPGIVRFALFIDGVLDSSQTIETTWAVTTAAMFAGFFAPIVGPGSHRYALYCTADNAVTITFTAKQRKMRVQTLLGQT